MKERSMVTAMCKVQLQDRKRDKNMKLMLGLNEAIDQLAIANSVHLHGDVLRCEDGYVLTMRL